VGNPLIESPATKRGNEFSGIDRAGVLTGVRRNIEGVPGCFARQPARQEAPFSNGLERCQPVIAMSRSMSCDRACDAAFRFGKGARPTESGLCPSVY
jgi:hypothetical protein